MYEQGHVEGINNHTPPHHPRALHAHDPHIIPAATNAAVVTKPSKAGVTEYLTWRAKWTTKVARVK